MAEYEVVQLRAHDGFPPRQRVRIRTAQFFIRRTFHRKYSNATAHKSVVPYQAARS